MFGGGFHAPRALRLIAAVFLTLTTSLAVAGIDFRQAANEDPTLGDIKWINSILQQNNSRYAEGMSVPQRILLFDIAATPGNVHSLSFNHQANKGSVHAYDFLTSWNQAIAAANLILPGDGVLADLIIDACGPAIGPGVTTADCTALRTGANFLAVSIPDVMGSVNGDLIDSRIAAYETALGNRTLMIYGNAPITSASLTFNGFAAALEADLDANYTLNWTSSSTRILIEVAGHLSVGEDNAVGAGIGYGAGEGASAISGGPYHFRVNTLDGASLGQQDNQIKGADVVVPFCTAGACDDGVDCTVDVCDEINDSCTNTPNNAFCSDGLFCNGVEICSPTNDCQPGTAPNCNDGVSCTTDSCDEATDSCLNTPNNAVCNDGLYCNGVEVCDPLNGCVAGAPVNCNDNVGCTVDTCNEATDSCVNTPNNAACDDGAYCNGAEACHPTLGCQAGPPPNCNDGVACTVDTCNEATDSCVNTPNNAACDDGAYCNGAEACHPTLGCQAGPPPNCDDGVACTVDTCNEATDSCVNTPNNGLCNDGLFCNGAEFCDPLLGCQNGTPPNCDDGVPCTSDSCDELNDACVNDPNDLFCDDGLFCNGMETCDPVNGCEPGTNPCPFPTVCDEVTDTCVGCITDGDCDDGLHCNGMETCVSNVCVPGTPPNCDDGVSCTIDECDEATDSCLNVPNNGLCNDGLFCNGVEFCDPINGCQAGTPPNCDDGVACTIDACDEMNDMCVNTPNDASCDDGLFCTGVEFCDPINGCQAGTPPNCDDGVACTIDSCDEANNVCANAPNNAACTDGLYCNGVEVCDPLQGCVAGTPINCNDGVNCTVDSCDEATDSCVNAPDNGFCDDGLYCNGMEVCNPMNGCQSGPPPVCNDGVGCTVDTCDEATDSCVSTPNNGACGDGQFCNGNEFCDPLLGCQPGMSVNCDDGVVCTIDFCDEVGDVCVHTPDNSVCVNGLFCDGTEVCDPLLGCQPGTPVDCDDGIPCSMDSCNEAKDQCVNVCPPPTIQCPGDVTFECDNVGDFGDPIVNDPCSPPAEAVCVEEITPGKLPQERTITRTCTITNDCGEDSCVQMIEVVDTTPPEVTCPPDLQFECDAIGDFGEPTVSDNCDPDPDVVVEVEQIFNDCRNGLAAAGIAPPPKTIVQRDITVSDGPTTVVADGGGPNVAMCTQTIEIFDTTPPSLFGCPEILSACPGEALQFTPPNCMDSCGDCTVICTRSDGQPIDSPVGALPLVVSCVAEDECGNIEGPCETTVDTGMCPIPAASTWGLIALSLVLASLAKIHFNRREQMA